MFKVLKDLVRRSNAKVALWEAAFCRFADDDKHALFIFVAGSAICMVVFFGTLFMIAQWLFDIHVLQQ